MEEIYESRMNILTLEELELLTPDYINPLLNRIFSASQRELIHISSFLSNKDAADNELKQKIFKNGFTLKKISVLLNISRPTLENYIYGNTHMPVHIKEKLNQLLQ